MMPGPEFWRTASDRRKLALVAVVVVGIVALAVVADEVSAVGSTAGPVVVTDVLGFQVVYVGPVPQYLGGPVCANCPVNAGHGARFVLTIWVDWVCPSNSSRAYRLASLTVDSPFSLTASSPTLPSEFLANTTPPAAPGNGTWSSGSEVLTLELIAPSAGGSYSLTGTLTVG
jgi:hypothetical protein